MKKNVYRKLETAGVWHADRSGEMSSTRGPCTAQRLRYYDMSSSYHPVQHCFLLCTRREVTDRCSHPNHIGDTGLKISSTAAELDSERTQDRHALLWQPVAERASTAPEPRRFPENHARSGNLREHR